MQRSHLPGFRLPLLGAALAVMVAAGSASADTLLTDFDNPPLITQIGSWPSGSVTPLPEGLNAQASGFGGALVDLDPNVDASGELGIELEVTVNTADPVTGLGVVLLLVDEDITEWAYTWFGLLPGQTHTLTANIQDDVAFTGNPGSESGLDLSDLTFVWVQVDPGVSSAPYDLTFNNLKLTGGPTDLVGDLNGDGFVGAGDLDILLGVWNQTLADDPADLNDDGFIGAGDLDILLGNWNAGTPPTAAQAVPEPASLALITIGGLAVLGRQRV